MAGFGAWSKLTTWIRLELSHLTTIHASDRLWQMPFAAALASGLPLLIGAYFNHMNYGLISSLGGLVFLYLPGTPLYHRMVSLMACAFGLIACYALGVMSHFSSPVMMPALIFTAILVTMVCRFYMLGPPGSLFFIMAASIGAYSPVAFLGLPLVVGLITMGCLLACLIGFIYSVYILRLQPPKPVPPLQPPTFDFVVFDSVVIGVFVGISLAVAQVLQLQKAYWVPVSCLAVIQGASLRAIWIKQLHRVLGTAIGLLVSAGLLLLPLDKWGISLTMMALTFVIEYTVVRHYAFATIFITPLTILLAEAASLGHGSMAPLIQARFFDTVLGCFMGLVGGVCLHSPRFREVVGPQIRRLIPSRLVP
ncbi:MAG TPA: FUSC family protein [Noviherbaspirillum sp.]|uniref:FUSC family protein n=1 Tax=Noviherbaspirillum sp. TaxID=1926288 RepID=UPI002B48DA53|nr:FUSC family protein [Noviherbaspirillum sp.]HJV86966.1 FUSC family protein [Noviherbaspirillum sp.]